MCCLMVSKFIVDAIHRMVALAEEGYLDSNGLALDHTEALDHLNGGKNLIWKGEVWALGRLDNSGFMFRAFPESIH